MSIELILRRHGPIVATAATLPMAIPPKKRRRWFLKEWREYRNLTQDALAERVGMTQGMVSHLETGRVPWNGQHLDILAEALMCEPADLIMRNPMDPEAPWSIWETLEPPQRRQAIEIMKALKRAGTG